jgi:hypothetical protein
MPKNQLGTVSLSRITLNFHFLRTNWFTRLTGHPSVLFFSSMSDSRKKLIVLLNVSVPTFQEVCGSSARSSRHFLALWPNAATARLHFQRSTKSIIKELGQIYV